MFKIIARMGGGLLFALAVCFLVASLAEAGRLPVYVAGDEIRIGENVVISFQRTLRVPDDGRSYGLPPGLGRFPIRNIADYGSRIPKAWRQQGGVIIPMYQREALWIDFRGSSGPAAVKVAAGKINAVTGESWSDSLRRRQDYVVVPEQPWLDGFRTGRGRVRQFVAMPLGSGATVEGQITGEERYGGIQIIAFDINPEYYRQNEYLERSDKGASALKVQKSPGMGLGEGGEIIQNIQRDPYGYDAWNQRDYGRVFVHIVNSRMWRQITGEAPPPSPVRRPVYEQYKFPWLDLYEENDTVYDVAPTRQPHPSKYYDEGNVTDGQW